MSGCQESTIRDRERLGNVEHLYVHLINGCRSNLHLSLLGGSGEFQKLDVGERSIELGFILSVRGSVSWSYWPACAMNFVGVIYL